jgi:hypothetical protein
MYSTVAASSSDFHSSTTPVGRPLHSPSFSVPRNVLLIPRAVIPSISLYPRSSTKTLGGVFRLGSRVIKYEYDPKEKTELYIIAARPPEIRSKDLEALLTSRLVRHEVKFTQRVEFAAATHATTLASVDVQIACEACRRNSNVVSSPTYPLLLQVRKPSGWVVDTQEATAVIAGDEGPDSGFVPTAHLDVPLAPGTYQLAIAAKNSATGEAGVVLTRLDIPAFESLGMRK